MTIELSDAEMLALILYHINNNALDDKSKLERIEEILNGEYSD